MPKDKKFSWLKSGLLGSSTLPLGTFPVTHHHDHHVHSPDGSCCGHDHSHDHAHEHHHHEPEDHVHGPDCGHDHGDGHRPKK